MSWHLLADGSSLLHSRISSLRPGTPTDLRGGVHCRPAGTAVGVATAFGAPIGGLLFAFEELAASFSQALGWQIFFACMLAVLVSDTLRSVQRAVMGGEFGIFEGAASTIIYEASHPWAFCHTSAVPSCNCWLWKSFCTCISLQIAKQQRARALSVVGHLALPTA